MATSKDHDKAFGGKQAAPFGKGKKEQAATKSKSSKGATKDKK